MSDQSLSAFHTHYGSQCCRALIQFTIDFFGTRLDGYISEIHGDHSLAQGDVVREAIC